MDPHKCGKMIGALHNDLCAEAMDIDRKKKGCFL